MGVAFDAGGIIESKRNLPQIIAVTDVSMVAKSLMLKQVAKIGHHLPRLLYGQEK
jgi:hypothetical protein